LGNHDGSISYFEEILIPQIRSPSTFWDHAYRASLLGQQRDFHLMVKYEIGTLGGLQVKVDRQQTIENGGSV